VFAFGTLVGVLAFYLPKPDRFSAEQVPQLGVIAQHTGMALIAPTRPQRRDDSSIVAA